MPSPSWADRFRIKRGDITDEDVDAIVNAANPDLAPGGGVCGAIYGAAGPRLEMATRKLGGCPAGQAKITPGFDLKARWIIHAVGPVWGGGNHGEDALLASCYRNSLRIAAERGLKTISFPSISTGIYGFPLERAARIAIGAIREFLEGDAAIERVTMVCFTETDEKAYRAAFQKIEKT